MSQQWKVLLALIDAFEPEYRPGAVASVYEDYPYREMTVTWVRSAIDQLDVDTIEEVTLHELLHPILFGPAHRFVESYIPPSKRKIAMWTDAEEAGVDLAAHLLMRLRPKGGWK